MNGQQRSGDLACLEVHRFGWKGGRGFIESCTICFHPRHGAGMASDFRIIGVRTVVSELGLPICFCSVTTYAIAVIHFGD